MDIDAIESVARQRITVSAVKPGTAGTSRGGGKYWTVDFNSGVTVTKQEIEQYLADDTGHVHGDNCIACVRMNARTAKTADEAGYKRGVEDERKKHPTLTVKAVQDFLDAKNYLTTADIAKWIVEQLKPAI